jgi:hypothetical protein
MVVGGYWMPAFAGMTSGEAVAEPYKNQIRVTSPNSGKRIAPDHAI